MSETFVLTLSVREKFKLFRRLGLNLPSEGNFFTELNEGLTEMVAQALPASSSVKVIDINDVLYSVKEKIREKMSIKNATIISLSAEVSWEEVHCLHVNRIVDKEGKSLGIGPRPGFPHWRKQIEELLPSNSSQEIVIVEDGTFTGSTIFNLKKEIESYGHSVVSIVVGVGFADAMQKLKEQCVEDCEASFFIHHPLDWIPDHDFIPFTPGCGKVYGVLEGDRCLPFYTAQGVSFSVPYILPFVDRKIMEKWTSLPELHQDISSFCLRKTIEYFSMLNAKNNCFLKVRDLARLAPQVSAPLSLVSPKFITAGTDVVEVLQHALGKVNT